MSATKARALLEQARQMGDARQADQTAVQAISADPDLGPAYGLRGALAARRGDPIVAAHYFRVAYARGDRSEITRAGLSACLSAVGEAGVAGRVAAGAKLPPALADFGEGLAGHGGTLRAVLSAPLPPAGQPAFLPGEKRQGARPPERPPAPQAQPAIPSPRAAPSGRVAPPARAVSNPRVAAPVARPTPPDPTAKVVRHSSHVRPAWLEPTRFEGEVDDTTGGRPDWLEDNVSSPRASGAFTGGGIELSADPGMPTVRVRSPITGRLIDEQAIARDRQGAAMPEMGAPEDPMEARAALLDLVSDPEALMLAVRLPGPVVTAAGGRNPRKLAEEVAFGLLADEIVLRDGTSPPARVPFRAIRRLEVLHDGAQISLHLQDQRQMHLDLRALKQRAPFVASRLVEAIAERL